MDQPTFDIKEEKTQGNFAEFVLTPLPAGYGHTLAVALRRVMLNSLRGGAIVSVTIEGVKHQFSSLKGMKEDVLDFMLNLKQVRVKITGEGPVTLTLSVSKQGEVKAGDIKTPAGVEIANPELVLATLSKGAKLDAEMIAQSGYGYIMADDREQESIGTIHLDASFSPVSRVNYKVEETRVGRVTNYDKLTFEVWTDGTLTPKEALIAASKTLVGYLHQIVSPQTRSEETV
jgi:DNA-directed RNA polymerase subunit alpha